MTSTNKRAGQLTQALSMNLRDRLESSDDREIAVALACLGTDSLTILEQAVKVELRDRRSGWRFKHHPST